MNHFSCCGTDCRKCSFYGNLCMGCNESEGAVFHAPDGKVCPIYDCVINSKKLADCGKCSGVPCEIWSGVRDPQFTDEQFEENTCMRIANLKGNQRTGDK